MKVFIVKTNGELVKVSGGVKWEIDSDNRLFIFAKNPETEKAIVSEFVTIACFDNWDYWFTDEYVYD